jgi:hypothetical protein
MKDYEFLDLANRVIDGLGSEDERTALETLIRDSTQRRLEFEQLSAVASILDAVRPVEPPDDLRDRILAGIPLRPAHRTANEGVQGILRNLGTLLTRKPWASLAYAAAGLVVGVSLSLIVPRFDTQDPNVFGTIGVVSGQVQDSEAVHAEGIHVESVLSRSEDRVDVNVSVETDRPLIVRVESESTVTWDGVETDVNPGFSVLDVSGTTIVIEGVVNGQYRMTGNGTGGVTVSVTFQDEGGIEVGSVRLQGE